MMRSVWTTACVVVTLGLVYACSSDQPLSPAAHSWRDAAVTASSDRSDAAFDTVMTLGRVTYLADDVSESAFIGPDGGEIDVGQTGASIIFPPGALARRTKITMTVKAGWNVAYEFGPHGIVFAAPVTVQQDLSYTVANSRKAAANVLAGYFARSLDTAYLDGSRSVARVSELRMVSLDHALNSLVADFYIYHFSGYILSSGFAGSGGDADSTSAQ